MKTIAVVSYPRTGSTHLCLTLAKKYGLQSLHIEPYRFFTDVTEVPIFDNSVVKFMAYDFFPNRFSIADVPWRKFDEIYGSYRENNTDGCISNFVAKTTNKWSISKQDQFQRTIPAFEIPESEILIYADTINVYRKVMSHIESIGVAVTQIPYSEICTYGENDLFRPTGVDYRSVCVNYNEVEVKLNKLIELR